MQSICLDVWLLRIKKLKDQLHCYYQKHNIFCFLVYKQYTSCKTSNGVFRIKHQGSNWNISWQYWAIFWQNFFVKQSDKICEHKIPILKKLSEDGIVELEFVRSENNDNEILTDFGKIACMRYSMRFIKSDIISKMGVQVYS